MRYARAQGAVPRNALLLMLGQTEVAADGSDAIHAEWLPRRKNQKKDLPSGYHSPCSQSFPESSAHDSGFVFASPLAGITKRMTVIHTRCNCTPGLSPTEDLPRPAWGEG